MADTKISQLPGATVPLSGTEVLPLVQSGTTTQVSVDNLLLNTVDQTDIGTAPNEIPLNQYLGTMAYQPSNAVNISGGIVSNITFPSGVANGVLYLNASKAPTSGSALTFDGTNLFLYDANGGSFRYLNTTNVSGFDIGLLGGSSDDKGYIYNRSPGGIVFGANNAEQMRLTSTGLTIEQGLITKGNTTLGDATTDTVTVNGYMGVGGVANPSYGINISSSALTGTSQRGILSNITSSSGATVEVIGVSSKATTAAAAFTSTDVYDFFASTIGKGAGSTITNAHGIKIADQTQGTNNYGITSAVSSGTNKWNIYASGTANNYFGGSVGMGTTPSAWGTGAGDYIMPIEWKNGCAISTYQNADNPVLSLTANATHDGTNWIYKTTVSKTAQWLYLDGQNGNITLSNAVGGTVGNTISWLERFKVSASEAVFNDPGNDYDFRVESDTSTHALFVQGSDGNVGVGTNAPVANLEVLRGSEGEYLRVGGDNAANARALRFTSSTGGASVGALHTINAGSAEGAIALATSSVERLRITSAGNVSIGGTANRATTVGTAALNIFNGTAPVGTLTNGISIYSSSGEAYVMDAAGNATLFSPHDAETNEWIFKSKHTPTGKVLKIDVERLLRFVNDHFGLDAVQEFIEP